MTLKAVDEGYVLTMLCSSQQLPEWQTRWPKESKSLVPKKRCGKARVYDRGQLEEAKAEVERKKQVKEENQN